MNNTSSIEATIERVWATLDRIAERQEAFEKQQEKYAAEYEVRRKEYEAQRAKEAAEAAMRQKEYEARQKEYEAQRAKEAAEAAMRLKTLEEFQAKVSQDIDKVTQDIDKVTQDIANTNKNLGGLGHRIGEIMETLLAAKAWQKFNNYNFGFERAYQRVGIYNGTARLTDVDILLSNGIYAMAIEVKNTLNRTTDVDDHFKRLNTLMQYPPAEIKGKKVFGAMACGVVDEEARDYAFSKGFFVLELTGDNTRLAPAPADFTPQEWTPIA